VATGEDQTESIIFDLRVIDLFVMQGSFIDARFCIERKIFLGSVEERAGLSAPWKSARGAGCPEYQSEARTPEQRRMPHAWPLRRDPDLRGGARASLEPGPIPIGKEPQWSC